MADKKKIAESAKKALEGTSSFVKANGLPILYVAGAITAAVVLFKAAKGLTKVFEDSQAGKGADKDDFDAGSTADKSKSATISKDVAEQLAENQFSAMADLGTDEDTLVNDLKGLNGTDLQRVYSAFGTRNYAYSGNWFGLGYSYDLFGWYKKELSDKQRKPLREIWAKSGLPITF